MPFEENDPLVPEEEGSSRYGSDGGGSFSNAGNFRASIRESRRFEPLIDRLKDVVRVYWHLGFIAFGG